MKYIIIEAFPTVSFQSRAVAIAIAIAIVIATCRPWTNHASFHLNSLSELVCRFVHRAHQR